MRRGQAMNNAGRSNRSTSQSKINRPKSNPKMSRQSGNRQAKNVISSNKVTSNTVHIQQNLQTGGNLRRNNNLVPERKTDYKKVKERQKAYSPIEPKPRNEERIIQTRKRKEYLDNFQYHEIKNIKNKDPNKQSVVTHNRFGDIIGGDLEKNTYERKTEMIGQRRTYSHNKTSTTNVSRNNKQNKIQKLRENKSEYKTLTQNVRRGSNIPKSKPVQPYLQKTFSNTQKRNQNKPPQIAIKEKVEITRVGRRNNSRSDIPTNKIQVKKEFKQYATNTNRRNAPIQQQKVTKTTRTMSNSREANKRGNKPDFQARNAIVQQRGNKGNNATRQKASSSGKK